MAKKQGEFGVGDLVQLKSGGPVMTVKQSTIGGSLECQWFSGKKLEKGFFEPATLVAAPPAEN